MPIEPVSAAIGIGGSILGGIMGGAAARRAKRRARRRVKKLTAKLEFLENNRQEIINPYEGYTDLSGMTVDRSSEMSNAYANLSVATQAAEMQIEQADISLANTLDTIMSTGAGAGGATALARAAAQSKKEVAASIEQQEVSNEKLRAQGEQNLESRRIQEKQRVEGVQMTQAQRLEESDASGQLFMFNQRENREQMKLDRTAAELDNARMALEGARTAQTQALTGMIGGISNAFANSYTPKD
tara:strand:+ start:8576 stop:9304 length:729 start_codon:yes stop_codon:yes gene_type:complete